MLSVLPYNCVLSINLSFNIIDQDYEEFLSEDKKMNEQLTQNML